MKISAGAQIVGRCVQFPECVPEALSQLEPEDFDNSADRTAFEAVKRLASAGRTVDVGTLTLELGASEKAIEYISDAIEFTPSPSNLDYFIEFILEKKRAKHIAEIAKRLAEAAQSGKTNTQAVSECHSELLLLENHTKESALYGDLLAQTYADIGNQSERVTSLGIHALDRWLGGGLFGSELTVVAGRPGSGKSALALQCAEQAALRGEQVVYCSLEMNGPVLVLRSLAGAAGLPMSKIRIGDLSSDNHSEIAEICRRFKDAPLYVLDRPGMKLHQLEAQCRKIAMRGPIGLVVVDYLQLMRASSKHGSREQEVAEISRGLKILARELSSPVLALAQLNRAVDTREDHIPQMSDLRESGAIEADADNILFIHRDFLYNPEANPRSAKFFLRKFRNGQTGVMELDFHGERMRFYGKEPLE